VVEVSKAVKINSAEMLFDMLEQGAEKGSKLLFNNPGWAKLQLSVTKCKTLHKSMTYVLPFAVVWLAKLEI
jgi:hypothetical protein